MRAGVQKLLFLGSSLHLPASSRRSRSARTALLTGPLEPTNEWYAIAKIAGIKLCQAYRRQYGCDFISAMPTNLYGPGDNFDLEASHVVPALIRKVHEAKAARRRAASTIWGTGTPRREFLHVDDLADACVFLLQPLLATSRRSTSAAGQDLTDRRAGRSWSRDVVGFTRRARASTPAKPDGTPRKLLDTTRLTALGWRPRIALREGLQRTYRWFLEQEGTAKGEPKDVVARANVTQKELLSINDIAGFVWSLRDVRCATAAEEPAFQWFQAP